MKSLKLHLCVALGVVLGLLGLSPNARAGDDTHETKIPGKQFMVARYTHQPPVIDGVFSPA